MKNQFLFPQQCKKIGSWLFVPSLIAGIATMIMGFDFDRILKIKTFALVNQDVLSTPELFAIVENGITDELLLVMIIAGGLLVGFSKLKNEDELIAKIRYESLVWAVYVNFGIMLLATVFIYGITFLNVMIANMFTVLFFFILRFHLMLYKLNHSVRDEE